MRGTVVYTYAMPASPEEYLRLILSPLTAHAPQIEATTDERGTLLRLSLDKSDMPRIIGREGATALAIRNLLRVYGNKYSLHISMKIEEPA